MNETAERYTGRVFGDITADRDSARLVLTVRERNSVPLHGCLFLLSSMSVILTIGIIAVVNQPGFGVDPLTFVSPRSNHMGFLWLVLTVGMMVGAPLYLKRMYAAPAIFVFSRPQRTLTTRGWPEVRFEKVEWVQLNERRDPDGRFLYEVSVLHDDGACLLISESYDERAEMNLANEVASFIDTEVRWR